MGTKVWSALHVFSVGVLLFVQGVYTQNCPTESGWLSFQAKCYQFNAYPRLALVGASGSCQTNGATLVSINTAAEQQFITNWLLQNDQRRDEWLTSGVTMNGGIRWDGDGTTAINLDFWLIPPEIRDQDGQRVIYHYDGSKYGWSLGHPNSPFSYICEISVHEAYRIVQEHRDFDYGLDISNPGLAPRGPSFLQQPRDTTVLNKSPAVYLECLASGNPEPTYEWFIRNSQQQMVPLPANQRYSFIMGKLEISNPGEQDENTYQCRAQNEFGIVLSSSVQLAFGTLGEFSNVPPAPVYGTEYDGIQMECPTIYAKPGKQFQWFKNNLADQIRPNQQDYIFVSSNGKLYFSELTKSDAATYYCLVMLVSQDEGDDYIGSTQSQMRTSLGFPLVVRSSSGSYYQPKIQNDFIYVYPPTPTKGRSVTLECFAYGTTPLVYSWSREQDKPLPRGHTFGSNNRILTLAAVELEDGGKYTCRVVSTRTGRSDEKTIDLVIQSKPYFTYPLTNQHVDIGSRLTWHCEAAGQPVPTYQWLKNGKVLTSSPGVTVNVNTVIIDSLDAEKHNGMYQCGATNRYGTTYSTAQLRVLQLPPSFTKNPMLKSKAASEGGNVTIICDPEAAPAPTYKWLKDDRDLGLTAGVYTETDHYKLLVNGNLVIQGVQVSDQGKYTCQVENSYGTAQDYTHLRTMDRTVISQAPADQRVEVNLTTTMLCQASYPPDMDMIYVWTFNDHVIDYYRDPEYRQGEGSQKGSLYIIATQFKNEGKYTCTATTGVDKVAASAYITVLGPPGEPGGVYTHVRPLVNNDDPNSADNLANPNTTRWIIWVDGPNRGSIITNYFVEFATNFDPRWRVHPDANNIPVASTINDQFPDKRYARLTNLKAGAGVMFRVKARNSFGIGPPSLPTPMEQIPGSKPTQMVQNVRGGGGKVGDLTIVWDPLPIEDHNGPGLQYRVSWRQYEENNQADASKWTDEYVTHERACLHEPDFKTGLVYVCKKVMTVGPLQFFKPYEVKIQPFNSLGYGPTTVPTVVMSAEEMPLGAPENVIGVVYNATALMVTWKPVPNNRASMRGELKGYKINYWRGRGKEVETQALQNIIELKPGQTNLDQGLIIGLIPVTWYEFNVQAFSNAGNGPKSSTYEQQTLNRVPSQYPTEVHVYSVEGFGVRVFFRGISTQVREEPLMGYKVQYKEVTDDVRSATDIDFGKMNTGVIRNLSSSALYMLRVFGYSRGGQGLRSPAVFFTVGDGQIEITTETTEIMNGVSSLTSSLLIVFVTVAVIILAERH